MAQNIKAKGLDMEPQNVQEEVLEFANLPAELRLIIFEYVFEVDRSISITMIKKKLKSTEDIGIKKCSILLPYLPKHGTALLRTYNQIYQEAMPIMYGNRTWFVDSGNAFKKLQQIAKPGLQYIERIVIEDITCSDTWMQMQLKSFRKNVDSKPVKVELRWPTCLCVLDSTTAGDIAKWIYPYVRCKDATLTLQRLDDTVTFKFHRMGDSKHDCTYMDGEEVVAKSKELVEGIRAHIGGME